MTLLTFFYIATKQTPPTSSKENFISFDGFDNYHRTVVTRLELQNCHRNDHETIKPILSTIVQVNFPC